MKIILNWRVLEAMHLFTMSRNLTNLNSNLQLPKYFPHQINYLSGILYIHADRLIYKWIQPPNINWLMFQFRSNLNPFIVNGQKQLH